MQRVNGKGFTLLELLIVIGILAILATAAVLVINPVEYVRQSRDAKRIGDVKAIDVAIATAIINNPNIGQGVAQKVYLSIPDTATDCPTIGPTLPTLPATWSYYCVPAVDLKKTNGTGWIPIDFSTLAGGSPLAALPTDPINDAAKGLLYGYVANAGVTAVLESEKIRLSTGEKDGGMDGYRYEQGRDLSGLPSISLASVPAKDPASVKVLIVELQDCGQNFTGQLTTLGFTNVVTNTAIATLGEITAENPDIVAASKGCWGVTKGALLNQAYNAGYGIYTQGNDTAATIAPILSSTSISGVLGNIAPLAKHAINTGWASTPTSGADNRQGLTAQAKAIVLAEEDSVSRYDEVIYLEEAGKGKWFHTQPSARPNDALLKNGLLYVAR